MSRFSLKQAVAVLLIISVVCLQTIPAWADAKKVSVAFLGIQFDNVPEETQQSIVNRLTDLLTSETGLAVNEPAKVRDLVGAERTTRILKNAEPTSLAELAQELNTAHIYGGRLSNNARDGERMLLVGELYRYDQKTNLRHKYEVLKYYDSFGSELATFKEQFVKTVVGQHDQGPKILPFLVLGGVVVAGILAFTLVGTDAGASGGTSPSPTPPLSGSRR